MSFILGVGAVNPLALWLSVVTGVAALVLTIFTDHHLGLLRVLMTNRRIISQAKY